MAFVRTMFCAIICSDISLLGALRQEQEKWSVASAQQARSGYLHGSLTTAAALWCVVCLVAGGGLAL